MDDFVQNYMSVLRRWSDFSSRATRREFWMFFLANLVVGLVLGMVLGLLGRVGVLLSGLVSLALTVVSVAVGVRRLHDTGRAGWWYLIGLVPFGGLVLLYFWVQDSQPGTNEYGPNPKENAFAYAV